MLHTIRRFFDSRLAPAATEQPAADPGLAAAALLVEVMNSDQELDERESREFLRVLQECLGVSSADLQELVELAQSEARQATSLYQFTRLINDGYNYSDKLKLIESMWRIAFADAALDKYEEHLIRKICDLIHVAHSDFIRMKLKARGG